MASQPSQRTTIVSWLALMRFWYAAFVTLRDTTTLADPNVVASLKDQYEDKEG